MYLTEVLFYIARYLQKLLSEKALANNVDVAAFLSDQDHDLYRHNQETSLIRTITDNVDSAKQKVKRAVGYTSKQETGAKLHAVDNINPTHNDYPADKFIVWNAPQPTPDC